MDLKKTFALICSLVLSGLSVLGGVVIAQEVSGTADVGNSAPTVNLVDTPSSVSLTPSETNNTFEVTCQYTDDNTYGDIDKSASYLVFGDGNDYNKTFSNAIVTYTEVDSTTENATITVENIPYYRASGTYNVECYVEDDQNASDSSTSTMDINTLIASEVNVSSLDFGSIALGSSGTTPTFKVENTGNAQLNSSWSGTVLNTTQGDEIAISNANITSGLSAGDMVLSTSDQLYASDLLTQTDGGNPDRYYEPNFELYVPQGTPAGTYNNTFTHSAVEA